MVLVGCWSSLIASEQSQESVARLGMGGLHRYFDEKGTSVGHVSRVAATGCGGRCCSEDLASLSSRWTFNWP